VDNCSTIVELLQYRAASQSLTTAFKFLKDGEKETETLTYGELDRRAKAIATQLQALNLSGERALLLYPSGLDYVAAFFGCLYASVIAVPAYPPQNQRKTPRIQAITKDAEVAIALTTETLLPRMQSLLGKIGSFRWLATDSLAAGIEANWQESDVDRDAIAFLQYTSGSTGTPKGVMVSHGNIIHNAAMTYRWMGHSPESKFISWLPIYHDMGLIGGILQPLYGGFPCVLMSPTSFLQRPYRWLQAISQYKGTTSGAPNFAYELCVQRITAEQRATLDLSSWQVAFNGAEPIRHETLELFAATFADCGFRPSAFYPCYGMAETTLLVSGKNKEVKRLENEQVSYQSKAVDRLALAEDRIVEVCEQEDSKILVGCGRSIPDLEIAIVNPETLTVCPSVKVGEIWVRGDSVAKGYWHRLEETEETFRAKTQRRKGVNSGDFEVEISPDSCFLRTGDLGFLDESGELFVTGRLKDLIIVRGRNLYPQDIELTAQRSHDALRLGSNAAFTVERENEERLVVVQELEFRAKPNLDSVITAIRQAVTEAHEIEVYGVVLIKPGSIPKTSSGKIQRRATRNQFLAGTLNIVASDFIETQECSEGESKLTRKELLQQSSQEAQLLLESYLQTNIARILKRSPQEIEVTSPLTSLGLDSLKVFELINLIEADLGVNIAIADLFSGLNMRSLSTKILANLEISNSTESISLERITTNNNIYPVSFAQARLWFLDRLKTGNSAYNIAFGVRIQGNLQREILEKALNCVIQRHEILRTSFNSLSGQIIGAIAADFKLSLTVRDYQQFSREKQELEVKRIATQEHQKPFNLSELPLLRATLLCLAPQEHILLINIHHIIFDGWSAEIFINELGTFYQDILGDRLSSISELPIQYRDFIGWQKQWLHQENITKHLDYWTQKLKGAPTILQLPTDRPRLPIQSEGGATQSLVLPKTLSQQLKTLALQENVTLFILLLAAFKILLLRHTGQENIVVGSPIANRQHQKLQGLIGFFVNTIPLRTNLAGNPSFQELLSQIRQVAIEAYTHQDLPFEQLVEALQPERNLSYTPIFQVMFAVTDTPKLPEIEGLNWSQYRIDRETAQFDLNVSIEAEAELRVCFEYNRDLFDAATIASMVDRFAILLQGIVTNPAAKLSDLPYLTELEIQQLSNWNNTQVDYPQVCFPQLFEAQVTKTPQAIALSFEEQEITYFELNRRANILAHELQTLGVQPDTIVGVCLERSLELAIALVAILKAGGAYLPLDCSYPQERLAFMLADANINVLLTQKHLQSVLPTYQGQIICLDDQDIWLGDKIANPVSHVEPDNLAYVIYTSGSTGTPKGVMNTHRGLVNRLLWMQDTYRLIPEEKVLQKTPYSFDVSVWEFFWPLLTGASLVIAKPGGHQDSDYLVDLIEQAQITTLHFVPSMLQVFLDEPELEKSQKCRSLKRVICSGEALSLPLQEKFFARLNCELYNLYGPTEAAIDVTYWQCQPEYQGSQGSSRTAPTVPIGRPIANTQIYILNRDLQPVPIGVAGELHIGGVGLARGYLNQPELTKEKFISIPPTPLTKGGLREDRLYKTGDLARYLPTLKDTASRPKGLAPNVASHEVSPLGHNGAIEYLGRIDHQVKIRGFRVELGEIEAVLSQHPAVRETVVVVREISQRQQLLAYIVCDRDLQWSREEGKKYLQDLLPEYMLPSAFVILDRLPLLPNGKINRRALPLPESASTTVAHQAPSSEIEQKIAAIWQEALQLTKVGIDDNFFDLGGHSLLLLEVNQKLRKSLQRDLSVVEMFQHPTIASLAVYLTQSCHQKDAFQSIRDRTSQRIKAINRQKRLAKNR
jgi:amino acid adenylation domain-containing protein